jgi:hypothetical protein
MQSLKGRQFHCAESLSYLEPPSQGFTEFNTPSLNLGRKKKNLKGSVSYKQYTVEHHGLGFFF